LEKGEEKASVEDGVVPLHRPSSSFWNRKSAVTSHNERGDGQDASEKTILLHPHPDMKKPSKEMAHILIDRIYIYQN
jgi:hypothetical protein